MWILISEYNSGITAIDLVYPHRTKIGHFAPLCSGQSRFWGTRNFLFWQEMEQEVDRKWLYFACYRLPTNTKTFLVNNFNNLNNIFKKNLGPKTLMGPKSKMIKFFWTDKILFNLNINATAKQQKPRTIQCVVTPKQLNLVIS